MTEKKHKTIHEAGKRKRAYARATITEGKGVIRINSMLLEAFGNNMDRLRIKEPLALSKDIIDASKIDISVNVKGGGYSGQIDAIRTSISRALVAYAAKSKKDDMLKERIISYDRSLIVNDARRTEPHKPSKSSQGPRAKRQKSYR